MPEHMCDKVFVYGSLMAAEVTTLLINRMPEATPAVLDGHIRWSVKNADYPAIIPADGDSEVRGLLLRGLSEKDLMILDEYEDDDYHRATVTVTAEDGSKHSAYVYVWNDSVKYKLDTTRPWDYDFFRREKLEQYVKMVEMYAVEISKHWEDHA